MHLRSSHLRSSHPRSFKNKLFGLYIRMIYLQLEELKTIAKLRKVKDHKSKSEDELIKIIRESKPKIEEIRKKFNGLRDRFCNTKIKEIRRNLYEIENEKNLFIPKIKEIEKSLFELKKYYDYDDIKYKGIRDVRNLFDLSIHEDYYKAIKTNDAFNNNYIEYESIGDDGKTLTIK